MNKKKQNRFSDNGGSLLVITAGILWATMGIFVRQLTAYGLTSIQISCLRLTVAAAGYVIILLIRDPKAFRIHLRDIPLFFSLGVCGLAIVTCTNFTAIQMMSMSVASILMYTSPIWVMLMSIVFFREKVTGKKLAALMIAFMGCILVSGSGGGMVTPAGLVLGIISGISYGSYSIIGTVALRKYPPLVVTTYSFLFAAMVMCIISRPSSFIAVYQAAEDRVGLLGWSIALGIVTAVIPHLLYTIGLKTTPASKAAILATIEPMMTTLFGAVIYKEPLTMGSALGILCILGAVVILNVNLPVLSFQKSR